MQRDCSYLARLRLDVVALFFVSLFGLSQAHALLLEIEPDSLDASVGDSVNLDIFARSLGTDLIGGFDIDLEFDTSLLAFNSVSFGTGLGDPDLFESLVDNCLGGELFCPAGPGRVNLYQVSFLDSGSLGALQPGSDLFLFSIVFDALAAGFSSVSFTRTDISDETGFEVLQVTSTSGATINSSPVDEPVPVPAPSVLSLLGIGLLLLLSRLPAIGARRAIARLPRAAGTERRPFDTGV